MKSDKRNSTAFKKGFMAAQRGASAKENPYPKNGKGSFYRKQWSAGYIAVKYGKKQ